MIKVNRNSQVLGALLVIAALAAQSSLAESPQQQSGTQPAAAPANGCIAVKSIGSHAFRNIMLAGVAGAGEGLASSRRAARGLAADDRDREIGD